MCKESNNSREHRWRRENNIIYLSVEINVGYFHLLQQQGEYKPSRIKIVTLCDRSVCTFHLCSLLVLQLCDFPLYLLSSLPNAGERTHVVVGQERRSKHRGRIEEINLYFFHPFLCERKTKKVSKQNAIYSSSSYMHSS